MPKEIYIDENGNERILSSSPSALSGLLDTDITTPSAGQVLTYDSNGKVVNTSIETDNITWGAFGGYIIRMGKLRIVTVYDGSATQNADSWQLSNKDIPDMTFSVSFWAMVGSNNYGTRTFNFTQNSNTVTLNNTVERGGLTFAYIAKSLS